MALFETTLASAAAVDARQLVFASASNVAIGQIVRVDGENFQVSKGYVSGSTIVPVLRGQQGTLAQAHAVTARVVFGTASDWANSSAPQTVTAYPIAGRAREVVSYGAAGAISLPTAGNDMLALINGTNALAMTLVVPTKDLDGSLLIIAGTGGAAHTVAIAGGLGGGALVTATFPASKSLMVLMAMDETWQLFPGPAEGTLTSIDISLST